MERRRDLLAIALVLGFTVSFALTNTTARLAFIGGSDPLTVANARFTFTTLALVVILWATGARFSLPRRDAYVAIALGVVTAVYSFAILSAIEKLGVSLAVLIFFLFPLFTSLIVAVMGWEKLTNTTMVAAVIAFAGLALTLGVDSENLAVNGIIYGLIGAFGLAVVSAVSSRVIRSGDSRPVTLYIVTTAAIVFIALSLFRGDFQLPQTSEGWVGYVGTSVFYAIGIIIYFATIAFIGPAKTALFSYVEPLFTMAAAFVFLGELLMPLQIVGALIVVGALAAAGLAGLRKR
ncbi:MAG: DMT family transporter [Alphaproteobacteria bacterium]|nr:DMT family transporter [Alphaproteobacteria bacterium]